MIPDTSDRVAWVARWLQDEAEDLDYHPDDARALPDLSAAPPRPRLYVLVGRLPVPAPSGPAWEQWFLRADRTVARTPLAPTLDVCTAFLGMDVQPLGSGPPLLFETRVVRLDDDALRAACLTGSDPWVAYAPTWRLAAGVHGTMCQRVRAWLSSHPSGGGQPRSTPAVRDRSSA